MKTFNFKWLLLSIVLSIASINTMYADDRGWWDNGAGYAKFTKDGSTDTECEVDKDGVSDFSMGNVDASVTLRNVWGKVWGVDKFNGLTFYYRVKVADAASSAAYSSVTLGWDNNWDNNQFWKKDNIDASISLTGLSAGNYEVEFYFTASGKDGNTYYLSNNGGNYHANFTLRRKITYHTDGSTSGSAPSLEWYSSATATVKDNTGLLQKTGKVFAGWATSAANATAGTIAYAPGEEFTITSNVDLYPVFLDGHYLISLTGSGSTGTKDGTNFYAARNLSSTAYTVNGVCFSKSYYQYGSAQTTIKGASNQGYNKFIIYDTERTGAKVRVYVYNKAAQAYKLYYNVIKEGTAASSDSYVSVPATSGKMITIDASSTKGARVYLTVENNSNLFVTEVIAIESGSRVVGVGRTNYELAFPGRPYTASKAGAINRDSIVLATYDNIILGQTSTLNLRSGDSYYAQIKTPAATQLRLTITSSYGAYVCTDKSNPTTTGVEVGGSSGTYNINLPSAGTYYVLGKTSSNSTTISKIAFADYVACTAPTSLAASDITAGGVTLTVTDGSTRDYEFYVSTSSTAPTASSTPTHSVTGNKTKPITGLTASTEYYAWVRAKADYFNKSTWVALTGTSFTTEGSSCTAPTSPSISGTTSYTYGQTVALTASASNTDASTTYAWYLGDPDDDGVLKQAASTSGASYGGVLDVADAGTYYCVIANSTCTAKASKTITIAKAAISPSLSYASTSLIVDDVTATPTISGNTGSGAVSYSSSATGVATVASDGKVTAKAAGSATITATIAATDNYLGNTATANFTIEDPCFYATDLKKKKGGSDISNGAEITASMLASGTITGGTLHNTSGGTLGHNETYGLVYAASGNREVTVTLSDVALQEGSLIKLTGYSNNATDACGFLVGGNAMSEGNFTPGSAAYTLFTRTYTVGGSSSLKDKTSFTITASNANKVYLTSIRISGCQDVYTVTLDKNDGTGGESETTVLAGKALTTVTPPTKTGYTFDGYYDGETDGNGSGTKYYNANGTSAKNWDKGASATLHAKWTANKYTITLEDYDPDSWGTYLIGDCDGGVDEFVVQYNTNNFDCYLNEGPTKVPYDFNGWYSGEGGSGDEIVSAYGVLATGATAYTNASGEWNHADDVTIYAKWTLTLSGVGAITAPAGAVYSAGTITFTYKSASTSAFTAATRTGYILDGYYTAADGDKVVNADGTLVANVTGWTNSDGEWIYSTSSSPSLYTKWTPITYTVAFDKDNIAKYVYDAEGSMDPVAATYDEYVTMPANTFTREGYTFSGWATSSGGSVAYIDQSASVKNRTTTNGATVTLYAVWTGNTVTVSFNPREGRLLSCRSVDLHVGDTYGSAVCTSSDLPEPEAPAGYVFTGWYTSSVGGTQVTKTDKVTTTSDHTLYARYVKQERVYFLNTLGWDSVFVTFDAYWDTYHDPSWGTGNSGREYRKMIKSSGNIYYYDVPVGSLNPWDHYIAFNNKRLGTVGSSSNKDNFDSGEAVFRMDFDTLATMFVPTNNKGTTADGNYQLHDVQYRSTGYADGTSSDPQYTSGYWRVFNDVVSGYVLTYEKNGTNSWCPGKSLNAEKAGDSVFVYTATLEANTQYNYNIIKTTKLNGKSDDFKYDQQINSGRCTDLKLLNQPGNGWMQTTVAGDYKFILTMKSDGHMYLSVEYPFAVNDYRVVYSYTKGGSQTFSSEYIKAKADAVDTISMFIHSGDSATSRSLYIQKCTAINGSGVPTWNTTYRAITLPSETASGKSSGVYNFVITQDGSAAATGECIGRYEGNYYIRCDAADGGWDHYKERADNQMTFSEYSMSQTLSAPFSHYYCKYVGSSSTDITYTVATDYSPMICPILVGDATIGGVGYKTLPSGNPASIRFTWNDETNGTFRSYLKSAQGDGNARFLVLHGSDNKVLDADGNTIAAAGAGAEDMKANELLFSDTENWVYELRFKAKPGAKVSIIARYNGSDRYLVGSSTSWETIISGGADTKYDIAAVYDFKTNRLITTWVPSGTISETIEEVDVLIERHNQDGATTITFGKASVDAEAGSITAKRIIGALRFDYSEMVGRVANWTPDTRAKMMFFISFPFDVNVSDIFGLNSTYGEAFIIQRYNGARRAEEGFFLGDGVETFWDVMPVDSVMHAHEGYVVTLDNDYFNGDVGHIWDNKRSGDHVYMYFPSANDPSEPITINSDPQTIKVPAHRCNIDRAFGKLNHKYTDSNWNLIGVPIFQNHTGNATSGTPGAIFTQTSSPTDSTEYADPDAPTFGYFFEWNTSKNYTIRSAVGYTFKPLHSYMVQYTGNVTFTCAEPVVPSIAARRTPMTANYNIELQVLNSDEEMINHTYVELRENAIDTFALNEDTYMITNSHAVNVYTFAGAYDVAANVLSIGNHVIPVGVKVNREGTYTFTSPSNFSGTVTLVDTYTGARTNLALSDYEVNLTQGTDEERFLLEINVNNTPTAIDGVGDGNGNLKDGKAHKFIMNDQMYILQNGIIYDARGARVK